MTSWIVALANTVTAERTGAMSPNVLARHETMSPSGENCDFPEGRKATNEKGREGKLRRAVPHADEASGERRNRCQRTSIKSAAPDATRAGVGALQEPGHPDVPPTSLSKFPHKPENSAERASHRHLPVRQAPAAFREDTGKIAARKA